MSAGKVAPDGLRELFANGMKGYVEMYFPDPPPGFVLNLGCGNSPISGAINLDRTGSNPPPHIATGQIHLPNTTRIQANGVFRWEAPKIDANDGTVGAVHSYHFLEHLDHETLVDQLMEVERVLKPGGLFYYCVPYAMSPIAFMDADHKTFWTEETMRTLLESRGYSSGLVKTLKPFMQIICGVTSQNLAVLGVLKKETNKWA